MVKTKKLIAIIILIVIGVWFLNILIKHDTDINIMKIAIYPTGTTNESYYFVLNEQGILRCSIGTRENDNIKKNRFLKNIENTAEIKLADQDVSSIMNIFSKLQSNGYIENKIIVKDSWEVVLFYKTKVYKMNYWNNTSDIFKKLIDEIIKLSPIPVDLHGWS